jgi:hypothetical protein
VINNILMMTVVAEESWHCIVMKWIVGGHVSLEFCESCSVFCTVFKSDLCMCFLLSS